jgi:hypothetical protein
MRSIILALLLLFAGTANAGTISLAWSPVEHPELEIYRVYFTIDPNLPLDDFANYIQVPGTQTETTITVPDCETVRIFVRACDSRGLCGDVSRQPDETIVTGWGRPRVEDTQVDSEYRVTKLFGANFLPDAIVRVGSTVLDPSQYTVVDCRNIDLTEPIASNGDVYIWQEDDGFFPFGLLSSSLGELLGIVRTDTSQPPPVNP